MRSRSGIFSFCHFWPFFFWRGGATKCRMMTMIIMMWWWSELPHVLPIGERPPFLTFFPPVQQNIDQRIFSNLSSQIRPFLPFVILFCQVSSCRPPFLSFVLPNLGGRPPKPFWNLAALEWQSIRHNKSIIV